MAFYRTPTPLMNCINIPIKGLVLPTLPLLIPAIA